jgi:alpha-tubulin suppressor-like RCC1 family protein
MRWAIALLALAGCDRLLQFASVNAPDAPPPEGIDAATPATCMRDVAVGRTHTCAVGPAGEVFCWGENFGGQSKPGGGNFVASPQQLVLPKPAVQVGAGFRFSCARLDDASVWCWGDNSDGELGTAAVGSGPVQIDFGGDTALDLEVGGKHACIVRASDHEIMCWGRNRFAALGLDPGIPSSATPVVVANSAGAKQLAVGHVHSCFVDAADHVWCWGPNSDGQVGDAATSAPTPLPYQLPTLGAVSSIAVSGRESCAVLPTGAVDCWGIGWDGQLGTGSFAQSTPAPTPTLETHATAVAVSGGGACTLHGDYTMSCWGAMDEGKGAAEVTPTPVATTIMGVTKIAAHYSHECVLANGVVQCWGADVGGQLGRADGRAVQPMPTIVPLPATGATAVATTHAGACAVAGGSVYCWGNDDYGQVGNNTLIDQLTATQVAGIANATGIAALSSTACAWGPGFAKCWGRDTEAGLGNGADPRHSTIPVDFAAPSQVYAMAVGQEFTCAIVGGLPGTVMCVGRNQEGELGIGTSSQEENSPQQTVSPALATSSKVVAGEQFACALDSGSVWCWGHDSSSQLGDGGTTDRLSPYQVSTPGTIIDVAAGRLHACALTSAAPTATIYCWGSNGSGQLGQGDYVDRTSVVTVTVPGTPVAIYAGGYTTCAKNSIDDVYCWGEGENGEIGDGATNSHNIPTKIMPLTKTVTMAREVGGGCAVIGGNVECWGVKSMLGDGDYSRSLPAPVSGLPCQ